MEKCCLGETMNEGVTEGAAELLSGWELITQNHTNPPPASHHPLLSEMDVVQSPHPKTLLLPPL